MARLFVIPARDAPVAVILRRGPSRWYHVIRWDTQHDQFTHGAWIKGRIYEEKCDVSPDGSLLVYFVHQGSRVGTEFSDSWTAVSRLPWLRALALWPQNTTYGGGGRFVGPRQLVLRPVWYDLHPRTHPDFPHHGLEVVVDASAELHQSENIVHESNWSGYDQKRRVIYTKAGCLYRRENEGDRMIADFSLLKPDPQPAPDWAKRPL
jgi:hypothetical protein